MPKACVGVSSPKGRVVPRCIEVRVEAEKGDVCMQSSYAGGCLQHAGQLGWCCLTACCRCNATNQRVDIKCVKLMSRHELQEIDVRVLIEI